MVGKICDMLNQKVYRDIEFGRAAEVNTVFPLFLCSGGNIVDDAEGLQVMPYHKVS